MAFIDPTGQALARRLFVAGTLGDHEPDPIDERHPGLAQRLIEIAEFQVRVGIYKAGQKRDRAEVGYVVAMRLGAYLYHPVVFDRHDAEFNWRRINWKDYTGLERKRHDEIVAEFATIRSRIRANDYTSALLDALAAKG